MEDQKRKHSVLVISLVIVFTVGVFIFMFRDNITGRKQVPAEPLIEAGLYDALPKIKCPEGDKEAYKQALEKKELSLCSCVKSEASRANCEKINSDILNFNMGIWQMDPALCRKISVPETVMQCEKVIQDKVEYLTRENPQQLAYTYAETGNYAKGAELVSGMLQKETTSKNLLFLATFYANQALVEHREIELVPKAIALVDQAIQLDSKNAEAYRVQGFVYEIKPDLELALQGYDKALEIDANYIPAYVGRGHANAMYRRLSRAIADFKKAKELDKDRQNPEIYSQLCRLEGLSPSINEAIEDCSLSVTLANGGQAKGEAYGMLAELYIRAGRFSEAKDNIDLALAYANNNASVMLTAAKLAMKSGDSVGGQKYAESALGIDPKRAYSHGYLAEALLAQDKAKEAIKEGEAGLALVEKDVSILAPEKPLADRFFYELLVEAYGKSGQSAEKNKYEDLINAIPDPMSGEEEPAVLPPDEAGINQ